MRVICGNTKIQLRECRNINENRSIGGNHMRKVFYDYAIISKSVLQDPRLTIKSKAIYAYLCCCAGSSSTPGPSFEEIKNDLGFKSITSYRKHLQYLLDYNYIKYTNNEYIIIGGVAI